MENTTPSSIENPQSNPEKKSVLEYALGFDQISDLRNRQREAFYETQASAHEAGTQFEAAVPLGVEAAQKVQDEYFNNLVESNYFGFNDLSSIETVIDKYSFLSMQDREWRVPTTADDGTEIRKKGSDQLEDDLELLLANVPKDGTDTEADDATNTPEQSIDPAVEAARAHLDLLRDTMATFSAKRQGKIFGTGGKKYEAAQEAYNTQVIKLGKLEKQSIIDDETVSDVTKKAEVVAYLFNEQNALRELSMDKLKGTKVRKFVEMMNKGNAPERIIKGLVFGAGVSLVAAGAGALIGAAGATVLVGGATAGIIGAGRFARGFARSDAKRGHGMQKLEDLNGLEAAQNVTSDQPADYFTDIHQHYTETFETDTSKEQIKRLKSVGAGVLGIALGTGIGFAAQAVADAGIFDGLLNKGLHNPFSSDHAPSHTPEHTPSHPSENPPSDGANGDTPPAADTPPPAPVEIPPAPEASYDPDFYVGSGEGGIEMFQSLGLTEGNWYEGQQELLQHFPNDFYSMGDGNVGISHPGQLSLEAQQFIKMRFGVA